MRILAECMACVDSGFVRRLRLPNRDCLQSPGFFFVDRFCASSRFKSEIDFTDFWDTQAVQITASASHRIGPASCFRVLTKSPKPLDFFINSS